MKAKTEVHLMGGDVLRVAEPYEHMAAIWAQMHRSAPGSAYPVRRITDHGKVRRVSLLAGTIFRIEEL